MNTREEIQPEKQKHIRETESGKLSVMLKQAEEALRGGDGRQSMELADRILDQDETCVTAWLIAMKSFQLLLPIEAYKASNEIDCARFAVRFAGPGEKYRVRKQIYRFFLDKILAVLKRDEKVLADGRSVIHFYQKTVYFDAQGAPERTRREDQPVVDAVLKSFAYYRELFEYITDGALKRNASLNRLAAETARQWQRTCSYLEIRFEMYHMSLSREMVEEFLRQYARFLRAVKGREEWIRVLLPFNIYRMDQASFLDGQE